jgi:hypothetical protein
MSFRWLCLVLDLDATAVVQHLALALDAPLDAPNDGAAVVVANAVLASPASS